MPNVNITIYLNELDYKRYRDNKEELNAQTRDFFISLLDKDKKLSQILSKEEIKSIKIHIEKKLTKETKGFTHAIEKKWIEDISPRIEEVRDPSEIYQIALWINGEIEEKLKRFLREEHPEKKFLFD